MRILEIFNILMLAYFQIKKVKPAHWQTSLLYVFENLLSNDFIPIQIGFGQSFGHPYKLQYGISQPLRECLFVCPN